MIKLLHVSLIDEDTVKIFLKDTENIKLLGHVLTNETSRAIMSLLAEEEMYPNEIANKLNLSLKLVLHYLDKLEKINLVIVTNKKLIRKGIKHKHYKMIPNIFIAISKTQKEIHETGFLKRIFKDSVKFAVIGLCAAASWFLSQPTILPLDSNGENTGSVTLDKTQPSFIETLLEFEPLTIVLLIIIIGITLERILNYLINKRKKKGI